MRKLSLSIVLGLVSFIATSQQYTYTFTGIDLLDIPDLNSYAEEIFPLYNRDMDTLYFVRSHHNENIGRDESNQDIWYSYKADGAWKSPKNFKRFNNSENNSLVGVGEVSDGLYLINTYTSSLIRDQGVVYTKRLKDGWSKVEPLDFRLKNSNNLYAVFINHLEDVMLITMYTNQSEGEEDLFVSLKRENGEWREPIYMGHAINSAGFETSPFLTDDKTTLFFSSNGFGGYGESDIFYSERLSDGWDEWSEPVNLGKEVNSDKFDGYFSIYENGEFVFSSNRYSKYSDIYTGKWTREKKPEKVDPRVAALKNEIEELKKTKVKTVYEKAVNELPMPYSIYFDFNKSTFDKKKHAAKLNDIIADLKANKSLGIIIEGHTDSVGDELYNLQLSLKRAASVTDYIKSIDPNISNNRLLVVPNGEYKLEGSEESSRRVTLRYIVVGS